MTGVSMPTTGPRQAASDGTVWVFILLDMASFAVLFGVLVWLQATSPALYESGQDELSVALGTTNTVLLLTSSLLVAAAVRAVRAFRPGRARPLLAGAISCGVLFAVLKITEYTSLAGDGHGLQSSDFFAYYFAFTGLHLVHVTIGVVVIGWAIRACGRPQPQPRPRDAAMVEASACYWHMVDLLWIVLFALLYLMG